MSAFDSSLAEYLTQSLGEEDENDISREKTCIQATALRKAHGEHYKKNSDKIAKLRNEISDFKELIYTLANKIGGNIGVLVKQYTIQIDDE